MAMLIALSVHQLVRLARLPIAAEMILTAAALAAMKPLMSPRPWLFTVLFFSMALLILVTRAREEGNTRALWFLPLIFAFWANLHIQFIYGLSFGFTADRIAGSNRIRSVRILHKGETDTPEEFVVGWRAQSHRDFADLALSYFNLSSGSGLHRPNRRFSKHQ